MVGLAADPGERLLADPLQHLGLPINALPFNHGITTEFQKRTPIKVWSGIMSQLVAVDGSSANGGFSLRKDGHVEWYEPIHPDLAQSSLVDVEADDGLRAVSLQLEGWRTDDALLISKSRIVIPTVARVTIASASSPYTVSAHYLTGRRTPHHVSINHRDGHDRIDGVRTGLIDRESITEPTSMQILSSVKRAVDRLKPPAQRPRVRANTAVE